MGRVESNGAGRSMNVPIPELPWYAALGWSILAAIAGFLVSQAWPLWRDIIKAEAEARQKEREAEREELRAERAAERERLRESEEARLHAWETIAQALEQISKTLTAMDFRLAAIERQRGISLPRYGGGGDRGE